MSLKWTTISLPDGRKQFENGYLKLLLHLLHSHTTDDLQSMPDRAEFNHRFLSPHSVRRREHCSTFIRNIVHNNGSMKQLEIVTELGILRSVIENAYRGDSEFCADSVNNPVNQLIYLSSRTERSNNQSPRQSFPETLEAFEQFGGLYVLLDLLFLDHRFRNLEPQFVTPTRQRIIFTVLARKHILFFVNQLIYFREEVKLLFLKSEVLLTLLADNYRYQCNEIDRKWIQNSIANTFRSLGEFKDLPEGANFGGIVTNLTETAMLSHTGSDHEQLIGHLEAIAPLVRRSSACRVDCLAVDGSIDMLINLFTADLKEYPRFHPRGRYQLVYPVLIFCLLIVMLILVFGSGYIPVILLPLSFMFILILVYISPPTKQINRKCELAGDILVSVSRDLHTNERALERFRKRDACRIIAQFINSREHYQGRYLKAINFILLMIDGHRHRRMGDIEVEKRRLRKLKIVKRIKFDSGRFNYGTWPWHFENILQFLQE